MRIVEPYMKIDLKRMFDRTSRALPDFHIFNYAIAATYFHRGNGRLPRKPTDRNATINDFIFHKMISNDWSQLHQFCADKEFSKLIASHATDVKIAKTVDVYRIDENKRSSDFVRWLKPFFGKRLIAKPTHGSGKVLFLDRDIDESAATDLFEFSRNNFFHLIREFQYKNLDKKILVEEQVSRKDNVNDYKFFCARGNVLYCEVDVDRFLGHKRAICSVPEFEIIPVKTKRLEIPNSVHRPARFDEMLRIASDLSRGFQFVRIDLYDVEEGIYFGEYTFSPGGACDNFSSEAFGIEFLNRLRMILRNTDTPIS